MPPRNFEDYEVDDHVFRFLYDKEQPEILHCIASWDLDPEDGIDVFFDGANTTRERTDLKGKDGSITYETLHSPLGIWWKWIDKDKKHVLIWSLFRRR